MKDEKKDDFTSTNFTIIDNSLFLDDRISSTDVIIYGLIASLSNNQFKGCYCTNAYLSDIKKITIRQVQNCINKLKKYDYIKISYEDIKGEKNKRVLRTFVDYQVLKRNLENNLIDNNLFDYDWINNPDEKQKKWEE